MLTKKMYERINWYKKPFVHEQYSRIVENFKNYDRISKKKMIEEIYNVYSDYNNIIDICTVRELKYLKKIIDGEDVTFSTFEDYKYKWEREILKNKFLIQYDVLQPFIPDEIIDNVKLAIKNVNWSSAKKNDYINELLVSVCKVQGSVELPFLCSFVSSVTKTEEKVICDHILHNKLFNYYVYTYFKNFEFMEEDIPVGLYQDYYRFEEEIDKQKKKQGIVGALPISLDMYKTLFYNDFDINNPKIKKMLDAIKNMPILNRPVLELIRDYSVLNIDRLSLKKFIETVNFLEDYDLTEFFKILDDAMDEMPSVALNGFTPNQAKQIKIENEIINKNKEKNYVKQKNACLSKKDAKLFYKIYFALLEFTNDKYKIRNNLRIYNQLCINPKSLEDVISVFWDNKNEIISEFCEFNPYKFNKEELDITRDFKKGFRSLIVIVKFESDYTAVMNKDKIYMIKGVNDNIDNIISYQDLPACVITSIIPFKNVLIYDGISIGDNIKMGNDFNKILEEDYSKSIKYYHL